MYQAIADCIDAICTLAVRACVVILAIDSIGDGKAFVVRYDGIRGRGAALFYYIEFFCACP